MTNEYTYLGRTVHVEMVVKLVNGKYTIEVRK